MSLLYTALAFTFLYAAAWILPYLVPPAHRPTVEQPFENSRFEQLDGVRWHYQITEPDPLLPFRGNVLLVHGFVSSSNSWRYTVAWLAALGYRAVTVDTPPFGFSGRREGQNHSPSNRARLLWILADRIAAREGWQGYGVGEEAWYIIGHSMGCSAVGAMVALEPHRVRKLVFTGGRMRPHAVAGDGGGAWYPTFPLRINTSRTVPRWLFRALPYKRIGEVFARAMMHPRFIRRIVRRSYGYYPDASIVREYVRHLNQEGVVRGMVDLVANSPETESYTIEPLRNIPLLIVWGNRDPVVPIAVGRIVHRSLPHSRFVVIDGAAHCPMETHCEAYQAAVKAFLDEE